LASHGGVLGALIALYLYIRKYPRDYLWLLDRLVIAGASLGGFIRLGNLMNSEIIGTPTTMPWAFIFVQIDQLPRHPAQLYEALCYFVICLVLFTLWRRRSFIAKPGFIFGLGLVLIFSQRFLMEFIKENQVAFEEGLIFNMGQILSLPLIVLGIFMMVWSIRRNRQNHEFLSRGT
jgi:prolipoprotein diacylglyceryl transferase